MRRVWPALVAAIILAGSFLIAEAGGAGMAAASKPTLAGSGAEVTVSHFPQVWLVAHKSDGSKATKRRKRLKALRGVNPRGASPIPDPPARR